MPKLPALREHRDRRALTQLELATLAGVHELTVWRIEQGENASAATARRLAKALRVEPAALMEPVDAQPGQLAAALAR
jgi:transcriptional regulator with XRE-family HTH domain